MTSPPPPPPSPPPPAAANNLKRKASSELGAAPPRTIDAENPVFKHLKQTDAKTFHDDYAATTTAIRELLCIPTLHGDAEQIGQSLKSRPEFVKMEGVKRVLAECGIEVEVEVKEGKEVVVVKLDGVVM